MYICFMAGLHVQSIAGVFPSSLPEFQVECVCVSLITGQICFFYVRVSVCVTALLGEEGSPGAVEREKTDGCPFGVGNSRCYFLLLLCIGIWMGFLEEDGWNWSQGESRGGNRQT